ncbi:MAG: hypothetical protein AB7V48_12140 [Sedimentibacter sp.]
MSIVKSLIILNYVGTLSLLIAYIVSEGLVNASKKSGSENNETL